LTEETGISKTGESRNWNIELRGGMVRRRGYPWKVRIPLLAALSRRPGWDIDSRCRHSQILDVNPFLMDMLSFLGSVFGKDLWENKLPQRH